MLSMFLGFNFDWPPAIKGIFNLFSLINFNFELLAPECSVSINFEAKWCVRTTTVLCSCWLLLPCCAGWLPIFFVSSVCCCAPHSKGPVLLCTSPTGTLSSPCP